MHPIFDAAGADRMAEAIIPSARNGDKDIQSKCDGIGQTIEENSAKAYKTHRFPKFFRSAAGDSSGSQRCAESDLVRVAIVVGGELERDSFILKRIRSF